MLKWLFNLDFIGEEKKSTVKNANHNDNTYRQPMNRDSVKYEQEERRV